jgi:CRP-like cAMP-binding protein
VNSSVNPWTALALLDKLGSSLTLPLPGVDELARHLQCVELRPREAAFHHGDRCPYIYIVRSGLLKQLYTEPDGSEWLKSFAGPGDLFACLQAIGGQATTQFASVAIEPSVVERIDYRVIERAGETSLAWQKAIRIVFQRLAEIKVQRERDLLTLSPRELYHRLAATAPDWIDRVPQKDLAGYLGVTAVGLNRIVRGARQTA